jgi:hypothetical protein
MGWAREGKGKCIVCSLCDEESGFFSWSVDGR